VDDDVSGLETTVIKEIRKTSFALIREQGLEAVPYAPAFNRVFCSHGMRNEMKTSEQ